MVENNGDLMALHTSGFKLFVLRSRAIGILLTTLALALIISLIQPRFLSPGIVKTILAVTPEIGVIAIGETLLIISGEFDLSVGSVMAFCSFIFVTLLNATHNIVLAIMTTIAMGALAGFLNGFFVLKFGISSFIITLGSLWFWRGIVYLVTGGFPIACDIGHIAPSLYNALSGSITLWGDWTLPCSFLWFILITLIAWLILEYCASGNHIYAAGSNVEAAKAMGVNVMLIKMFCFMLLGILTGVSALLQVARVGSAYPLAGQGYELYAIASAVIGGTLLRGGVGTVWGTFIGVILLGVIDAGLVVLRVPTFWFQTWLGIMVIIVSIINTTTDKLREKIWRRTS